MGISGILGALSLLGFVAFLGGIAIIVLSSSQGRSIRRGVSFAAVGAVVGILFSVISQGIIVVPADSVGVIFNTVTGQFGTPQRGGTTVIFPVFQTATIYPIYRQTYTMAARTTEGQVSGNDAVEGRTVDGQEVFMDVSIIYAINPDEVNKVHVDWGDRYQNDFIRPTSRGIIRDVISGFQADQIYGIQRTDMQTAIHDRLTQSLSDEGFMLVDLVVRNITFSDQFTQAIEAKQSAQQQAEQAAIIVDQRRREADQLREQAAGQRDAAIAQAQGDAQSIILRAQAQAEGLRLVSQQIAANPSLIQYLYIQNLSDNVRMILVPSNSPYLFDFNSLAAPNSDFTAPPVPPADQLIIPEVTPTVTPGN